MQSIAPGLVYGVYSYAEAARLLRVSPRRVARWADGYSFPLREGWGVSEPVLQSPEHRKGVLSFPELMELFFVREFVAMGVSLSHVRRTAEALAQEVGAFPFTRTRILVSGRELLVRKTTEVLHRPDIGQLVFSFAEDFARWIETEGEEVRRYYPPEFNSSPPTEEALYLDRSIRAGEPVVSKFAVPTRIIYHLWQQEQDIDSVADYFELPKEAVELAIRFEAEWRLSA